MIEMVNMQRRIDAAAVAGKYVVMSMPLTAYQTIFPGTSMFVESAEDRKAKMYAWPIKVRFGDDGLCEEAKITRGGDGPVSNRLEAFNGFICDSESDVIALMDCRNRIEKIISANAGYVEDSVIKRQLMSVYADAIAASRSKESSPDMRESSSRRSFG